MDTNTLTFEEFLAQCDALPEGRPISDRVDHHSVTGDCAFFFNENGLAVAERVDDTLTIYRDIMGGRIIGVQVKGLSAKAEHHAISVSVTTANGPQASHAVELLFLNLSRVGDSVDDDKRPQLVKDYREATRFVEQFAHAA